MRQIIIKHIIQLNQENSLHQYKKRDTRILKSQRLKEVDRDQSKYCLKETMKD